MDCYKFRDLSPTSQFLLWQRADIDYFGSTGVGSAVHAIASWFVGSGELSGRVGLRECSKEGVELG